MKRLLTYRDARLLLAGQTLSAFGDWALLIVLAVWIKTLTGSSAAAGMTFFVFGVGALAAPLGGLLADRVRRRPLMIASDAVLGATVLLLLLVRGRDDVWLIYLVALVYGLAGTVFYPARSALLRLILPEELLGDANGALSAITQGLRIVAPLAGAALFAASGGGVVAVLDSVTFAASALFLLRMRVPEERPAPPEHHFVHEVSAGVSHVWRTLPLRQITLGVTVALLVIGFAETLIFSVIGIGLHRQPSFFGVLSALQGTGAIAGGVTAGVLLRRLGDVRLVGLGLLLFAGGDALLVSSQLPVVLLGFAAAGVGIAYAIVGFSTALQLRTPLAIQGRVSAAADVSLSIAQTTSIAAGAALSTVADYRILLVAMAAVTVASATYLLTRRHAPVPSVEHAAA
jgi:Na+/melibiose symporter-like transporter